VRLGGIQDSAGKRIGAIHVHRLPGNTEAHEAPGMMLPVTVRPGRAFERVLVWCHRWNEGHPWDHNAQYHRWILRQLPTSFDRALDVGCGTGDFARRLSARCKRVDGLDIDAATIATARQLTAPSSGVEFTVGDVLDFPLSEQYDAITALASVHHLPLTPSLRRLREALVPGGTLVVLGCYQEETHTDWLLSWIALPANLLIGGMKGRRRPGVSSRPISMTAHTAPATTSLAEIRRAAVQELPHAVVRRHLFWRYSLVYRAPGPATDR
jgi:SAM-dependent methyltransferase